LPCTAIACAIIPVLALQVLANPPITRISRSESLCLYFEKYTFNNSSIFILCLKTYLFSLLWSKISFRSYMNKKLFSHKNVSIPVFWF
jgi:hypothetical protein